jgi:hypothetical protein
MRLYQLNHGDFNALKQSPYRDFLLVECQVFGQQEHFLYHVVVSNELADTFDAESIGREIIDTGRTVGFWQNLGGKDVLGSQLASTLNFPEEVIRVVRDCKEATIRFNAPTWEKVILMMPFTDAIKSRLNVVPTEEPAEVSTKEVSTTRKKKGKKSVKK